jgi:hypothetical protein
LLLSYPPGQIECGLPFFFPLPETFPSKASVMTMLRFPRLRIRVSFNARAFNSFTDGPASHGKAYQRNGYYYQERRYNKLLHFLANVRSAGTGQQLKGK